MDQSQRQRQDQRLTQEQKEVLAQTQSFNEAAQAEHDDLADEIDPKREGEGGVAEAEHREPHEKESEGDSQLIIEGDGAASDFDLDWKELEREGPGPLPLIAQLRVMGLPAVNYRITKDFEVKPLNPAVSVFSRLRLAMVQGIADHLRGSGVRLEQAGDWCQIPAIGSDEKLLQLTMPYLVQQGLPQQVLESDTEPLSIPLGDRFPPELKKTEETTDQEGMGEEIFKNRLGKRGKVLKGFAILLPSGDVVTPGALIAPALSGKKATRAAALRLAATRPSEIAGEDWSKKDWQKLEGNEREHARKRSRPDKRKRR